MPAHARALAAFIRRFGAQPPPRLFRAPGRVNLIGEHTDYNDGFVLPVAIDRDIVVAASPRSDRVEVYAADLDSFGAFRLADLAGGRAASSCRSAADCRAASTTGTTAPGGDSWLAYARGMAWALAASDCRAASNCRAALGQSLTGLSLAVAGDVPIGAGLSSSAALEVAIGYAFLALSGLPVDPIALAKAAQRAENDYVGVRSGIMDQLISCLAQAGHALLIDCRSLVCRAVPLPPAAAIIVVDSGIRRGLLASEYNARRAQCEQAAALLGVPALRDADEQLLSAHARSLPPAAYRRARHVITENARTEAAARTLAVGDLAGMGRLMDASHASLRDDFEVSTPQLDALVGLARRVDGVYGARLTGAGFGGCIVALAEQGAAAEIERLIHREYEPAVRPAYPCQASSGACELLSPP